MPHERQPSHPIIDSRDDPMSPGPAALEAHLRAHGQYDERQRSIEDRLLALEQKVRRSDPVVFRGPGGWTIVGRGWYLLALAALALAGLLGWLKLR